VPITSALQLRYSKRRASTVLGPVARRAGTRHAIRPTTNRITVTATIVVGSPASTVFIDDRDENVRAARRRGWSGIAHESFHKTVRALHALEVAA